jgi:replication factor C large subunit
MWVEKYRPHRLAQLVGNEEAKVELYRWLEGWKPGAKPILLVGPPGVGKTTAIYALAEELGYRVMELNASDFRTKERLSRILSPMTETANLFGEKPLIFLDEVDGLLGRQDYGGLDYILKLVAGSPLPVAMAANMEDDERVRKLARKAHLLRFRRVPPRLVHALLQEIVRREGLKVDEETIASAVEAAGGDVRAAINNLQNAALSGEAQLAEAYRDRSYSRGEAIQTFLEVEDPEEALVALSALRLRPREKVALIYTSIVNSPLEPAEMAEALRALAKADELVRQIERTQEWRLLRYLDKLLVHSVRRAFHRGRIKYHEADLPWWLRLRIWNDGRALRSVARRLARQVHASAKDVAALYLPYLIYLLGRDKGLVEALTGVLRLEEGEVRVLLKEAKGR